MGFLDELKKLTQPYDEDDDFYDDEESEKPARAFTVKPKPSAAKSELELENKFGAAASSIQHELEDEDDFDDDEEMSGGLFGNLGKRLRKQSAPSAGGGNIFSGRDRSAAYGAQDSKVILFNPTSFDEAGELVDHLDRRNSVVMTLEGLPVDTARRLLDFISGIAFALHGKITPVSAKTYFISPENVDLLGSDKPADSNGFSY